MLSTERLEDNQAGLTRVGKLPVCRLDTSLDIGRHVGVYQRRRHGEELETGQRFGRRDKRTRKLRSTYLEFYRQRR
jgi:hypothetical protein